MRDGIELPEMDLGGGGGTANKLAPGEHAKRMAVIKAQNTVPVVEMATGQIQEVYVPPMHNGKPVEQGDQIVVVANGRHQIAMRHEGRFELYKDWSTKKQYEMYREMMVQRANGIVIRIPDPSKFFSKKLMDHRKRCRDGSPDGKAWVPGEGIVDDPGKDRVDAALRAFGVDPPEEPS